MGGIRCPHRPLASAPAGEVGRGRDLSMGLFGWDILGERKHFSIVFFFKKKKSPQQIQYISNNLKEPFLCWVLFFLSPNLAFWGLSNVSRQSSDKSRKTKPIRIQCMSQRLKDVLKGSLPPPPCLNGVKPGTNSSNEAYALSQRFLASELLKRPKENALGAHDSFNYYCLCVNQSRAHRGKMRGV